MPSVFPSYAAIFLIWVPLMLISAAAIIVNRESSFSSQTKR